MEGKGPAGEVRPVEGLVEEALEGFPDLLQQLAEQGVVGGVVDRQVEGEVFAPRRALLEVHGLHGVEPRFHAGDVVRPGAVRRDRARLDLEPAADLERLHQPVAQGAGVDGQRQMDGVGRQGALEDGAAAAPRLDDAARLELAQHLPHRRASDGERFHQGPLGRQTVSGAQRRFGDEARESTRHRRHAVGGGQGGEARRLLHARRRGRHSGDIGALQFGNWSDVRSSPGAMGASRWTSARDCRFTLEPIQSITIPV